MFLMLNRLVKFNEKGVTLVELLATLILISIVSALAYSIFFQGYGNYQRIKVETELRDEADLIMASFVKDLFVLKESEIKLINSCATNSSHLVITKKGAVPGSTTTPYKTGFENQKVLVKDQQVQFYNENIELVPPNCSSNPPTSITKLTTGTGYTIKFTLKSKNSKKNLEMQFSNTVKVIDDSNNTAAGN